MTAKAIEKAQLCFATWFRIFLHASLERYGDRLANCQPVSFPGARGRVDPNRATPVATIEGIVEIVLLDGRTGTARFLLA